MLPDAGHTSILALLVLFGGVLATLTALAVVNLDIQGLIGVGLMTAMGLPAAAGLLAGSAALGAAAATFGLTNLIAGGVPGGPLAIG